MDMLILFHNISIKLIHHNFTLKSLHKQHRTPFSGMFTELARMYLPTPNTSDSRCSYIPQPRWQRVAHVIVSSIYGRGRTWHMIYRK